MNELVNDGVKLSDNEINFGFANSLSKKWLNLTKGLRNSNHVRDLDLVTLYGKYNYEENLIAKLYATKTRKP